MPFPPNSFDVVLCGDLIEHLRAPEQFLARVQPLHREDGRLVLTTPNVANWAMRLGLLAGRWRYTDRGILDSTHLRFFTRRTLGETLERAGYRILELDFTVPVPGIGAPSVERAAHALGRLRPSLLRVPVRRRCDPGAHVISVVIPVKDGGLDLVRCLEAIARQQVDEEVEVVVVDSGSTDGSVERARSARGPRSRDPSAGVHPRRRAQSRRGAGRGRRRRLHVPGRVRRGRELARRTRGIAPGTRRRRGRLRPPTPARERDPVGALLPGLPVRAKATHAAAHRPRPAQLRGDALLERELGGTSRRTREVSTRNGRDHERGPGVVETRARGRSSDRVRAPRGRPPLARVHHRRARSGGSSTLASRRTART